MLHTDCLTYYERQRLARIEENRAQLAMLGLGASEAGASEGGFKVVAKARPSRGAQVEQQLPPTVRSSFAALVVPRNPLINTFSCCF